MIRKIYTKLTYFFISIDVVVLLISVLMAPIVRYSEFDLSYFRYNDYQIYLLILVTVLIFFIMDLNDIVSNISINQFAVNYIFSFVLISISSAFIYFIFFDSRFGRGVWIIQLVLAFLLLFPIRVVVIVYVRRVMPKKKFLIIGLNENTSYATELIGNNLYAELFGILKFTDENSKSISKDKIRGTVNDINSVIEMNSIQAIVLTDKHKITKKLENTILKWKMRGVQVYDIPGLAEMLSMKVPIDHINDFWIIFNTFSGLNSNIYNTSLKRVIDVGLSIFGLILTLPIIILTMIIIKLESRGPVFYRQIRVGYNEEHFEILKFRSMRVNAEKDGAVWAKKNDDRITFFGRFIRKVRIDEIPQLINILRGEMSIVGPRPERPEFVGMLSEKIPYYSLRHMVKPGLTGWAQINYPYGASIEDAQEKLKYDLYYIRHLTMKLDLFIILKTARTVLLRQGAR